MISPSKVISLLAVGCPLALLTLVAQADVFSLSGEVVRLGYAGSSSESFGLIDGQGELIAMLQADPGTVLLAPGSARVVVEQASGTGSTSDVIPVLLVADHTSNFDGRETSDPFSTSGPPAFSGNIRDRSQLNWAGNGQRPHLPSAQNYRIFESIPRAVPGPLTEAAAIVANSGTTAGSSSVSPEAGPEPTAAVQVGATAALESIVAPALAAQVDGSNLRLTWMAPAGAQCLVLGSLDAAGPYEVISSQVATEDGLMSLAVPLSKTSGFLRLQINFR
jgi:hypothetical protein